MARLLKCYGTCDNKYPKEELRSFKGKNYCNSCYEEQLNETAGRNQLYSVIKEYYNISYPTGFMLKQIKEFHNDRGYSYQIMAYTIKYIADFHKNIKLEQKYGLSIIPHFIDEARNFIYRTKILKEQTNSINLDTTKKVKAKAKNITRNNGINRTINMEDLIDE